MLIVNTYKIWIKRNWLPIFTGLVLRLIQINSPILGIHSWRQADTAAMARHFFLENTPIWLPQIDWGGASQGFVESEFPLFPYLIGLIYQSTGINEAFGRLFSALCSTLTIIFLIRIGEHLFDNYSAWWGGFFFAITPMSVYYGRNLQAESLLLLLAAISIEQLLEWHKRHNNFPLIISWLAYLLACLIKVLPLIWLGIPLLCIHLYRNSENRQIMPLMILLKNLIRLIKSPAPWLFFLSTILISSLWYRYAYEIGQISGLSFGFWGSSSDRANINLILNINTWLDLLLRIILRNLSILGLPILIIGIWNCRKSANTQILISGIIGWLICTLFALKATSIHEYYQLPLLIFICPIMGKGWQIFVKNTSYRFTKIPIPRFTLIFMIMISLAILNFDYWSIERQQSKIWMPLAYQIRNEVPIKSKIVSVTGHDPTLLNLARRQGWLTTAKNINQVTIRKWFNEGATHIAGNLEWEETYSKLNDKAIRIKLEKLRCSSEENNRCPLNQSKTYLLPINTILK